MRIYQRNGTWFLDITSNGQRIRRRIHGARTRTDARAALTAVQADILRGTFNFKVEQKRTFEEMVAEYIEIKADKRSLRCDRAIFNDLKTQPMFKGRLLTHISADDIEE